MLVNIKIRKLLEKARKKEFRKNKKFFTDEILKIQADCDKQVSFYRQRDEKRQQEYNAAMTKLQAKNEKAQAYLDEAAHKLSTAEEIRYKIHAKLESMRGEQFELEYFKGRIDSLRNDVEVRKRLQ